MQSPWEKALLVVSFALVVLLCLAAAAAFVFLLARPALASALSTLPRNPWWLIYREPGPQSPALPLGVIAATVAAAATGGIASFASYRAHRRNPDPAFLYLQMVFFSLAAECLRGATGALYASEGSISAALVLTRVVYWGRYVGLFALLLCGVTCIEMRYRRVSILGGTALLIALIVAASVPLDRSTFLAELTWKLGDEQGVGFTNLVIAVLSVLSTVGASVIRRERRFLVVAGGFVLILAARELLFFGVLPLLLAGAVGAFAAGAVVCLRTLREVQRD